MRVNLFLLISLLFFSSSCNEKDNSVKNGKKNNLSNNKEVNSENFEYFFKTFKKDTLFQKQRILNPITFITLEEEQEIIKKQNINYVSFSQKDWYDSIALEKKYISEDTINVILKGTESGLKVNHFFTKDKKSKKWYLVIINDESD